MIAMAACAIAIQLLLSQHGSRVTSDLVAFLALASLQTQTRFLVGLPGVM
jgi:hypothetical protein